MNESGEINSGSAAPGKVSDAAPANCRATYLGPSPPTFFVGVRNAEGIALTINDLAVHPVDKDGNSRTSSGGCGCGTGLPLDGDACYAGWSGGVEIEPYRGVLRIEWPGKPAIDIGFEMPAIPCGLQAYIAVRLAADGVPSIEWAGPRIVCR